MEATIIIYTYDRKDYILRALESAVHQTIERDRYEIIVVKGFKDSNIDEIIEKKADKSLYVNEKGHGKKIAPAIMCSTGDVIFILDDDDEFTSEKLEHILRIYGENKDILYVHDDIVMINDREEVIEDLGRSASRMRLDLNTNSFTAKDVSLQLEYRANWYGSCMSFRRDILISRVDQIEKVEQSIDPFLYFIALDGAGILSYIPEKLTRYRVHESTTNYRATFKDFFERRKNFYLNTLKTYSYALEIHNNDATRIILEAEINHIRAISILFSVNANEKEIIHAAFSLFESFLKIKARPYFLWMILCLVSVINRKIPAVIFYHYVGMGLDTSSLFWK